MNALGMNLVWAAIQATLLCVATGAVYFAVRRRQPGAGAIVVWSGLLLCGVLTLALFSPWPNWSVGQFTRALFTRSTQVTSKTPPELEAARNGNAGEPVAGVDDDSGLRRVAESPAGGTLVSLWRRLATELAEAGSRPASPVPGWPGWIATGIVLSMILGGAQLLTGWFGVRRCLQRSRPLTDSPLNELVLALQNELGLDGNVAVRESDELTCAATVGSRAPVILLPPDWRTWSPQELRAVLAHELAHVAAGDARTWLVAQFGLLLHFYHPLVHWLAQRLRLEQELAADAVAARLTGSSQAYLATLASLAVRHAARPAPWPLRAFLPSPGTLFRRIEMLRDTRQGQFTSKRWRRGMAGLLVVLCAVLVAGVRPEQSETAEAEQRAARMSQSRENLKTIALAFHNYNDQHKHLPRPVLIGPDGKTPYSWRVAILPALGEQVLYDQYDRNQPWDSEQNRKVLEQMPAVFRHPLDDTTSTNSGYFVFSGADTLVGPVDGELGPAPRSGAAFGGRSGTLVAPVDRKGLGFLDCRDGSSYTLLAVEARHGIPWTKPEDLPYSADQALPKLGGWFDDGFHAALGDGSVRCIGSQASEKDLRAVITRNGGEVLDVASLAPGEPKPAVPAFTSGREAQMSPQELTRLDLKRIALAFHGYHDLFGHFPPPVSYGPDGKTPYSWRVELLPVLKHYVDGVKPDPFGQFPITRERYNALIAESGYDISQSWDSEANRKVLAQIPDVYRSPLDEAASTNASYFVLTGDQTAVGNTPGKGSPITNFHDGLSNTLLLVEAKRDIPWTKPEDLPVRDYEDPPEWGWQTDGMSVAFADGSVRFIAKPADASALRILITPDAADNSHMALKKLGVE